MCVQESIVWGEVHMVLGCTTISSIPLCMCRKGGEGEVCTGEECGGHR